MYSSSLISSAIVAYTVFSILSHFIVFLLQFVNFLTRVWVVDLQFSVILFGLNSLHVKAKRYQTKLLKKR